MYVRSRRGGHTRIPPRTYSLCAPIPVYSNNNIIIMIHVCLQTRTKRVWRSVHDRGENKKNYNNNNNNIVTINSTESFDLRIYVYRRHGCVYLRYDFVPGMLIKRYRTTRTDRVLPSVHLSTALGGQKCVPNS